MRKPATVQDEWLEEVDAFDRVVGRRRRGEIHRLGLRHRAVHILVFDGVGRLFLQKRSMSKDSSPGLWDTSAAGHVDFGESYDQSAARELEEELGIRQADGLEFLFKLTAEAATGWEFIQVYRLLHEGPMQLHPGEIDDGKWMSRGDLERWLVRGGEGLTITFQFLWRRFCASA
jgi:isopentenyldiphosphate isomerase